MKPVLRDVLLIAALFAAILLVPLVMKAFDKAEPQKAVTAPALPRTDTPAPPEPVAEEKAPAPPAVRSSATCSLAGVRFNTGDIKNGDMIIVGGDSASGITMPRFNGGGGTDTLKIDGPGAVQLDGRNLVSVENVSMRNGAENAVMILAAGLVTLEDGKATITGDAGQDTAYLDACLQWGDPEVEAGAAGQYLRYEGRDSAGNTATVLISRGMKVRELPR